MERSWGWRRDTSSTTWDNVSLSPQLRVRSFTVDAWTPTDHLLKFLGKSPTIDVLEVIDIQCGNVEATLALGALIRRCNKTRRIQFDLSVLASHILVSEVERLQSFKVLSLLTCDTLESFHTKFGVLNTGLNSLLSFDLIEQLPPNIQELLLEFTTPLQDYLAVVPGAEWRRFTKILSAIPNLISITFLLSNSGSSAGPAFCSPIRDDVLSKLADLHCSIKFSTP